jgi:hypothetical protein
VLPSLSEPASFLTGVKDVLAWLERLTSLVRSG